MSIDSFVAAKELGVSQRTVNRWCKSGKIQGAKEVKKGNKNFWEIPEESIVTLKNQIGITQTPNEIVSNSKTETHDRVYREAAGYVPEGMPKRGMTQIEADVWVKTEDAIRKYRENIIAEKKVISIDEYEEKLGSIFDLFLKNLADMIDTQAMNFSWPNDVRATVQKKQIS